MASVTPKLRSRKHGAAIPLDDFDKRLLNAMQGSFPIAPRPYAEVARALEVPEERVLARVQELVDERIIRQVTPIYDTRALGYGSMLVAAKVDPEVPWRAAASVHEPLPSSPSEKTFSMPTRRASGVSHPMEEGCAITTRGSASRRK